LENKVLVSGTEVMEQTILHAIRNAEDNSWTGVLRVLKNSEQFGIVFIHDGRIAWATSTSQAENFGSLLERVGNIPKERQKEIFQSFKDLGQTKEFGILLEETGLITRSTLRECLKSHISAAIVSLQDINDVIIKSETCELSVHKDLSFRLEEVLPDNTDNSPSPDTSLSDISGSDSFVDPAKLEIRENILQNLATVTGYQYSFVCDSEAKLLAVHKSDNFSCNTDELVSPSISWIMSSTATLRELDMGQITSVLLEYDKGALVAQWPNGEMDFFIAASFDKSGKPGVIKHKISEIISSILLNQA
jgi:hypothetical protein